MKSQRGYFGSHVVPLIAMHLLGLSLFANDETQTAKSATQVTSDKSSQPGPQKKPRLTRMLKDHDLWIHAERKFVVVNGEICLREGPLEMFACTRGTKEHESIVTVNCPARFIHAALLAVEAQTGSPVQYDPKYKPASGTEINILILWKDKDGKTQRANAQQWVQNSRSQKQIDFRWVFAGSSFWTDESTGEKYYQADGGDLICVSNFTTAMLDLPIESSQDNGGLLFNAFTERIPPLKTKVKLILQPRPATTKKKNAQKGSASSE